MQQDLFKCEQLWERAAEQGDEMASENLATLREHMKLMQKGVFVQTGKDAAGKDVADCRWFSQSFFSILEEDGTSKIR